MGSGRMFKRTPTKSLKTHCHHSRCCHHFCRHRRTSAPRCSPAANAAAAAIFDALNKSIFTCQRRIFRLFSKLARIGTPGSNRPTKGFTILKKQHFDPQPEPRSTFITPRALFFDDDENDTVTAPEDEENMAKKKKKTIFLDLDETLVHSTLHPPSVRFDFVVRPRIDGEELTFFVVKRPGVDEFLERIAAHYEVVVFTAGLKEYASLVLDRLDWKRIVSRRLYRDSCKEMGGKFVKDLSLTGRDLCSVVIVDDNPNAYSLQPENAVPINPFIDDLKDRELTKLVEFLEGCDGVDDMRVAIKKFLGKK